MSKKRDFSLVVWAFGWLLNLATLIKKHVDKLGVPFEAFAWLVSDKGESTLEKVIRLIKEDHQVEQSKLLANILYGVTLDEIRTEYSPAIFTAMQQGTITDKIKDLPKSGLYSLEFEILEFGKGETIDEVGDRLAREGKRFATLSEALQFMIDGQNGRKATSWTNLYALGTVYALGDERFCRHRCYVHSNMDGLDYGCTSFVQFMQKEGVRHLVVKSSTFIRESQAA